MSSKKSKEEIQLDDEKIEKRKESSKKSTDKSSKKESKKTIPQEWIDASKENEPELDKEKRRSLISALKRSISVKGPTPGSLKEPMNIVITLSPAKHADIIEYIEENVPAGGKPEWVRDSMRLKMRIERGIYGLNTSGQDTTQKGSEETLHTVLGQFAEAMTKVMTDIKTTQVDSSPRRITPTIEETRSRPTPRESTLQGGPPQIKKIDTEDGKRVEEIKPDRPSLDDAISSIVVVE
ncbi:MAG: hypothetical protein JXA54_04545 [Candidatus Heimdallarchaeota archaeon]|nr:hypothetical protein [Candidatus Heimdallarchaeota archaeon]